MVRNICHVFLIGIFLSGCATIVTGTKQSVSVNVVNAPGAKCAGVDKQERKYYWNDTPSSVMVQKGDGPMILTCEKKGYKKTVHKFDETFQGATLGNILLGGVIGVVVDAASGAAQIYPNEVKLVMEPEEGASKEEIKKYAKLKKELEEEARRRREELGLEEDEESTGSPQTAAVDGSPKPHTPENDQPRAGTKTTDSSGKPAGREVASVPDGTQTPPKTSPDWSAYLNGEDYHRVDGFGPESPLAFALYKNTAGKVVSDESSYGASRSKVSNRLIGGIKRNLERLAQNRMKSSSPKKILTLVKVSGWEVWIRSHQSTTEVELSAKVTIRDIGEDAKIFSSEQITFTNYGRPGKPFHSGQVLELIDETAEEISKKLIERRKF